MQQIGQEFAEDVFRCVIREPKCSPREGIASGIISRRLPSVRDEARAEIASNLRHVDGSAAGVLVRDEGLTDSIPETRPKSRLRQTAITWIEMKCDIEPQRDGVVRCRKSLHGREADCVSFRSLSPLRRHIPPLLDASPECRTEQSHRLNQSQDSPLCFLLWS